MINELLIGLANRPVLLIVILSFFGISIGFFLAWRNFSKTWLLHAHLATFLIPVFLTAYALNCSFSLVQGLLSFCATIITKILLVVLPLSIIGAFLGGYYVLPLLVRWSLKAKKTNLFASIVPKTIKVWTIDSAKPVAFSTQKNIFLSVGLIEILSKKEAEAVVLHEVSHVINKNSWTKLTSHLARYISPFSYFSSISSTCEQEADAYAASTQGTWHYVRSARRKVREF